METEHPTAQSLEGPVIPIELHGGVAEVGAQTVSRPVDLVALKQAARTLLDALGVDHTGEMRSTPRRIASAFAEMMSGYQIDPADILAATGIFDGAAYDQIVMVRDIPFVSLCEHHLLPFQGTATLGYLPAEGKIVGLSKLARLVECYARRLQMQERMTMQIATAIETNLSARGVAVVVKARHSCMAIRGVKKDAETVTSAMLGVFREERGAREEFLALAR